jgi:hypothetical protein
MKYLYYAGLVALMVLFCLPAGVSAATTDTVVVSGSIGGSLSVDVTPDAGVSWGAMSGTKTDLTSADLTVVTTYPAWHVDAADAKTTNKGYMVDATAGKLTNAFHISNNGGSVWTAMTGSLNNFAQKTTAGAGTWPFDIGLQQVISGTDPAGSNYQITVTFTGAAS